MSGRTMIVGVGNPLFGADAFGPAVLARLETCIDLPPHVSVVDAGTDLLNHLDAFAAADRVVFVDALLGSGTGDVRVVDEAALSKWPADAPDVHSMSLVTAVGLFRRLYSSSRTEIQLVALDVRDIASSQRLDPKQVEAGVNAVARTLGLQVRR